MAKSQAGLVTIDFKLRKIEIILNHKNDRSVLYNIFVDHYFFVCGGS